MVTFSGSTKGSNVLLHPLQSNTLVSKAKIGDSLPDDFVRVEEPP
jgi:hypothetical protein